MKMSAASVERKSVEAFAQISSPGVTVFKEKLDNLIQIYGHTSDIFFDSEQIYFVS